LKGVEVKCGEGIPKFKCDFIVDYTVGGVRSFKAAKCTHRKNFKKCAVTLETDDGCVINAFLYNKQKTVYAKGPLRIECPWTTTAGPTEAVATTEPSNLPEVKAVGDGCMCVPNLVAAVGFLTAQSRSDTPERPQDRKRGRVRKEVQCKGVPKFECDFSFDYEACGRINKLTATKCTHRTDVKKCPIELKTKDGCIIRTLLTNKKGKMLAGRPKISWGDNPLTGFMTRCVCLQEDVYAA